MGNKIKLDLADRSYDIIVESGVGNKYGELIKDFTKKGKLFIITDDNVAKYHLEMLEASLEASGIKFISIILPHGESTKSFANLEKLLEEILSHKPNRNDSLLAFGGGVIGDITGLAASILLRGVNFIQIPTTLLSMVDSSVGGKTGVNSKYGKNLIGSFYQPKIVIADTKLLETLPVRELRAGYAEVLKYALIDDTSFFKFLEKDNNPFLEENIKMDNNFYNFISEIVVTSCKSKAAIVNRDEREGGVRALLNLGHSFGHAIESELGYDGRMLHGEAVSIGMSMAFYFSSILDICDKESADKVKGHLVKTHLPVSLEHIDQKINSDDLLKHMMHDKKNLEGNLVLILVKGLGKAYIEKNVKSDDVKKFLGNYLSGAC